MERIRNQRLNRKALQVTQRTAEEGLGSFSDFLGGYRIRRFQNRSELDVFSLLQFCDVDDLPGVEGEVFQDNGKYFEVGAFTPLEKRCF